jgi:hypothetical protein
MRRLRAGQDRREESVMWTKPGGSYVDLDQVAKDINEIAAYVLSLGMPSGLHQTIEEAACDRASDLLKAAASMIRDGQSRQRHAQRFP